MSLNFFFKLVGLASAAALDYCSSLGPGGDQTCETLRHTSGSAVYLDTGELKTGVVAIETLRNMTGVRGAASSIKGASRRERLAIPPPP